MSQPALVLLLATAIAVIVTVAIASAVSARRTRFARGILIFMVSAALLILGNLIAAASLRLNVSASMPPGIYRFAVVSPREIHRGMLVAVCAPSRAARLGLRRGYVASGECAENSEPLLKTVAALAGDDVAISPRGVEVNGRLLRDSKPLAFDRAGRPLVSWPRGHFRISRGTIWLHADHERSWDSRYWGPVPARNVLAKVVPVLIHARR
jgi:conjugative transfer signal peptidase TraF